ncbi:MAG: RNase adapter RapZ [Eubacterium sp.]|nr:RNase adapter RapZ [Eubacterium sp.]
MAADNKDNKLKVVLVTGLSGAGKTNAIDWFEDRGYYCIDNMPPLLIKNFLYLTADHAGITKVALASDTRGGEFFSDLEDVIEDMRRDARVDFSILFMEASTNTLIKRYSETRRNHPLTNGPATAEVIERERSMLSGLRKKSDFVLDTTRLKLSEFSTQMTLMFSDLVERKNQFAVNIVSFGYKYGIPQESDITLDMRFIPNPFYVNSLRRLTGNNKKIREYIMKFDVTKEFITKLTDMVQIMIPHYIEEGKYHLNLAFGCTGGQHRSVAMANIMAEIFEKAGYRVSVDHRELRR